MTFKQKKQVAKNLLQLRLRINDPLKLSEAVRSYKNYLDISNWPDQKDIIGYYLELKREEGIK